MSKQIPILRAAVQIPLCDLRLFSPDETGRLRKPAWMGEDPSPGDFLRGFGQLQSFRDNPVESTGLNRGRQRVDARRIIRFPDNLESVRLLEPTQKLHLTDVKREFFASSFEPRAYLQVSFRLWTRTIFDLPVEKYVQSLAAVPVRVSFQTRQGKLPNAKLFSINELTHLVLCGHAMRKVLLAATTRTSFDAKPKNWWMQNRRPLIAMSVANTFASGFGNLECVQSSNNWELRYGSLEYQNVTFDVWLEIAPVPTLVHLAHLSRFHAQRVVLLALIEAIALERFGTLEKLHSSTQWQPLQNVLNEGMRFLDRKSYAGKDQNEMHQALDAELNMKEAEWETLRQYAGAIRPAVAERLISVVNKVHGDVVMNHRSGDIYNVSGHAGYVGPHGHIEQVNFSEIWKQEPLDLPELSRQLAEVWKQLNSEVSTPQQSEEVAEVAKARAAAEAGNGPQVLDHLAKAGKWVLSVAEKIGAGLAVAAIKTAMGL